MIVWNWGYMIMLGALLGSKIKAVLLRIVYFVGNRGQKCFQKYGDSPTLPPLQIHYIEEFGSGGKIME